MMQLKQTNKSYYILPILLYTRFFSVEPLRDLCRPKFFNTPCLSSVLSQRHHISMKNERWYVGKLEAALESLTHFESSNNHYASFNGIQTSFKHSLNELFWKYHGMTCLVEATPNTFHLSVFLVVFSSSFGFQMIENAPERIQEW